MSNFHQSLEMSSSYRLDTKIINTLKHYFKGIISIVKNKTDTDDHGVDWIVTTNSQIYSQINIDVKIRNVRFSDYGDLSIEVWSNIERQRIGWIEQEDKLTDYILWVFLDDIYKIYKFKDLQKVFLRNKEKWVEKYFSPIQFTDTGPEGYHSQCVFVPVKIIEKAIKELDPFSWEKW